ncbi:DEAD/DEAH box helicase [Enterococcus faecalis]|nr:DEAD/DEAH box helicase [Enterococcus faecalis]ELY8226439.1 DEAD/DEAH box helicase [Enterococcus faecalis]
MSNNLNVLSDSFYNDEASQKLVDILQKISTEGSYIYYDYLLTGDIDEGTVNPKILFVNPYYGVFLFDTNDLTTNRNNSVDSLYDEIIRKEDIFFSRFLKSKNKNIKKGRRELSFRIESALFLPYLSSGISSCYENVFTSEKDICTFLTPLDNPITPTELKAIFEVIDYSSGINRPSERPINVEDNKTKAALLNELEQEIANFDNEQRYAALSQLNGPQRIRGLAGSGKTIILCMKAAALHLKYPQKKILYTFMTKSLYDYIELLITRFYKVMGNGSIPDFDKCIHIRHSWGGRNIKGVYYEACKENNIIPLSFRDAKANSNDPFDYVCNQLLEDTAGELNKTYDYVILDEAQDFNASFYQICRGIVKDDCIVWGYDNLQNIYDINIQDTVTTFENKFGAKGIDLNKLQFDHPEMNNDVVLPKCYRNPKEILVSAHAIGFGIYNEQLIQSFENNEQWNDLGYEVVKGNSINGDLMEIRRPKENSPLSISEKQEPSEIIELYSANSFNEEIGWIVSTISNLISQDKLLPEDIMVISLDDRNAKKYFEQISSGLRNLNINTHNLSSNLYEKGFIKENCVTLSTVYKAKGNESGVVFVIGVDVFEYKKNGIDMRNKVFTAFTRSKAWLKVSGYNITEGALYKELNEVIEKNFILEFIHKDANIIKRDLNNQDIRMKHLRDTMQKLESKGFTKEQISEALETSNFKEDI